MVICRNDEWDAMACLKAQSALAYFLEGKDTRLSLRQEHVRWGSGETVVEEDILLLARAVREARSVLWEEPIYRAAAQGCASFETQVLTEAMLPRRPLLFFHPRFYYAPIGAHIPREMMGIAELLLPAAAEDGSLLGFAGACFHTFPTTDAAPAIAVQQISDLLPWVTVGPVGEVGKPIEDGAWLVALSVFLGLPFVEQREEKPGGPRERRQHQRKYGFVPEVATVALRRAGKPVVPEEKQATDREYHCSWLVSGHWRARAERWGPGEPIYVREHLKGPADQPFRAPRPKVYHAKR